MEKLYRVEPIFSQGPITLVLRVHEFPILRKTPGGYWIQKPYKLKQTFVLKGRGKRFAHESEKWALDSLMRRRVKQAKILRAQLQEAEAICQLFESGLAEKSLVSPKVFN